MMKFKAIIGVSLLLTIAAAVPANNEDRRTEDEQQSERSVATASNVTVSLCVLSGNISVRGWDREQVTVRTEAPQIDFGKDGGEEGSAAVKKLELFIFEDSGVRQKKRGCQGFSDVDIQVPQGATVQVQTRDGNISIVDVAAAYAGTQNGDISVERIGNLIEAASIGGSIVAKESAGRASLTSIGGVIEAVNLRPINSGDSFDAASVSGDIMLAKVSHARFNVKTVSGNVNLNGPLAAGGRYGFLTMSGDVTLVLPDDSSFELSAKVSGDGLVVSDFPLQVSVTPTPAPVIRAAPLKGKAKTPPPAPHAPKVYVLRRVNAVIGSGDANISVSCFSGKVHLQKN